MFRKLIIIMLIMQLLYIPIVVPVVGDYNKTYDISSDYSIPRGLTNAGNYLYPVGYDGEFNSYTKDTATKDSLSSLQDANGLTIANGYFYELNDAVEEVYKYNATTVSLDNTYDISGMGLADMGGITYDGSSLWITDHDTDKAYEFYMNLTPTGNNFSISETDYASGIGHNGNVFLIIDSNAQTVYEYSNTGSYTGNSYDVTSYVGAGGGSAITVDDEFFYVSDTNSDKIYAFEAPETIGPCDCPGINKNWTIEHSDSCVINDVCDLGNGTLSFTGNGTTVCNSTISSSDLGDPTNGGKLEINSNCLINIS